MFQGLLLCHFLAFHHGSIFTLGIESSLTSCQALILSQDLGFKLQKVMKILELCKIIKSWTTFTRARFCLAASHNPIPIILSLTMNLMGFFRLHILIWCHCCSKHISFPFFICFTLRKLKAQPAIHAVTNSWLHEGKRKWRRLEKWSGVAGDR